MLKRRGAGPVVRGLPLQEADLGGLGMPDCAMVGLYILRKLGNDIAKMARRCFGEIDKANLSNVGERLRKSPGKAQKIGSLRRASGPAGFSPIDPRH